jgi:uncharacterized membrane protein
MRKEVKQALEKVGVLEKEKPVSAKKATGAESEPIRVSKAVTINSSADKLFNEWRNFEGLPRFMKHLKSVTVLSETKSHWVAKGPVGSSIEWDAEIVSEVPNRSIAWKSVEGADVPNEGTVTFNPSTIDSGTRVQVELLYNPPAGEVGRLVAKLFGEEPEIQVEEDLKRFKDLMEKV